MPECPTCEVTRDSWQKLRLHHRSEHGSSLPNRRCERCGEQFFSERPRKYCSDDCRSNRDRRDMSGENNPNWNGGKETTSCEMCGTSFDYYPSEKPGRFCPDCVETNEWQEPPRFEGDAHPRWQGGKIELTCEVCETEFERYPSNATGEASLCSNDCRAAWLSKRFTGAGHPNYAGGPTGPYGRGWNEVRERALDRDEHACVLCGADTDDLGRNPDVHHIVPVRTFVESPVLTERDAHTLDNVVTLCPVCHRRAEFGSVSRAELRWRANIA